MLHIGMLRALGIALDAAAVISIACSTLLIHRLFRPSTIALWLFILAQALGGLAFVREQELGQREHFLVFLVLPYLILAAARLDGRPTGRLIAVLAGVAAAAAICLKPQHILSIVLVELLVLGMRRTIRTLWHPAVIAFSSGILVYLVCVETLGRAWLQNVYPMLVPTYWAFDESFRAVVRREFPPLVLLSLGWVMFWMVRRSMRFRALAAVFGIAAIGSAIAYLQQHKGWPYQYIPAETFTVLFLGTLVIGQWERWLQRVDFAQRETRDRVSWAIVVTVACTFCIVLYGWHSGRRPGYIIAGTRTAAAIYRAYPAGTAVGYISTTGLEIPAVIDQHKVLGQRFYHFWLLPAIIRGQDPQGNEFHHLMPASQIAALSLYQRKATAEDLAHWKTSVVVINECGPDLCDALGREHYGSILNWFMQDPDFQREWQHYQRIGQNGSVDVFQRTN